MKPQRRHAIGSSIGICEKDENLIVQYQNDLCLRICGDKLGSKCTHGCMKNYQRRSVEQGAACDYLVIERMETDLGIIDALVVEHSEGVTTLLFEKTETIAMQIKSLSGYGLSRAETKVVRRVLEGFSNTTQPRPSGSSSAPRKPPELPPP